MEEKENKGTEKSFKSELELDSDISEDKNYKEIAKWLGFDSNRKMFLTKGICL